MQSIDGLAPEQLKPCRGIFRFPIGSIRQLVKSVGTSHAVGSCTQWTHPRLKQSRLQSRVCLQCESNLLFVEIVGCKCFSREQGRSTNLYRFCSNGGSPDRSRNSDFNETLLCPYSYGTLNRYNKLTAVVFHWRWPLVVKVLKV